MNLHIQVALIAILGMVLQVLLKYKSLSDKATNANVSLSFGEYLKQDFIMLIASLVTIGIFVFMLDNIVNMYVKAINWVKFLFAFVGYTGSDIILRLFSAANKKLNNIIDAETGYRATKINIEEGKTVK